MTRDEVARECERLGWSLSEDTLQVVDREGYRVVTLFTVLAPLPGSTTQRAVASGYEPKAAYLEACRREGKTPF